MSTQRSASTESSLSAHVQRRPVLFVMLVLLLLFVASYAGRLAEYRRLQNTKETLQVQIAEAEARGRELVDELDYVKSPEYVEEVAISKLDMARKGDVVLTIIDAPVPVDEATLSAEGGAELPEVEKNGDPSSTDGAVPIWRLWMSIFLPKGE